MPKLADQVAPATLVEHGYYVLPLGGGDKGKDSINPGGVTNATNRPGQVKAWAKLNPRYWGIACKPSRLLVIDLDRKNGIDGVANFNEWLADKGLAIPDEAPRISTQSGGIHIYLRLPDGVEMPSPEGCPVPGVDLRSGSPDTGASGFYVVAYGDPGPWEDLPQAPADLLEALRESIPSASNGGLGWAPCELTYESMSLFDQATVDAWMAAALQGIAKDLDDAHDWPEGHTDEHGNGWERLVFVKASKLARLALAPWNDLDEDRAYDLLTEHAPEGDTYSVEDKWARGLKTATQHGRQGLFLPCPVTRTAGDAGDVGDIGDVPSGPTQSVPAGDIEDAGDVGDVPSEYPQASVDGLQLFSDVRAWFGRYIKVLNEDDLNLMTLWSIHTWVVEECYTTPRLLFDSPVPESGKTTALEHLGRFTRRSVQMASVTSPALLTRMLNAEMRTILIDEVDRSLRPDMDGVQDLIAVMNSGYKRGGTRPVLMLVKKEWVAVEMPTFSPVAMAGNNPNLPADTRSRTVRVLLMPAGQGEVEETDWEQLDEPAATLQKRISQWADENREAVKARPELPEGITNRFREKWAPLKRIANVVGGHWPETVDRMALADKAEVEADKEDGMITERPHMLLVRHLAEVWPTTNGIDFMPTNQLIEHLVAAHPEVWGEDRERGFSKLTPQRMGKMMASNFKIHSGYKIPTQHRGPKGYRLAHLEVVWDAFNLARGRS